MTGGIRAGVPGGGVCPQPGGAWFHINLGTALGQQGKLAEAVASLRRAVQLDPNLAIGHCTLGLVLTQQGRFREGLAASERGHQLGSKTPGWRYPFGEQGRDRWRAPGSEQASPPARWARGTSHGSP
jgi:tetratricopeptide (TPR) repeat protein